MGRVLTNAQTQTRAFATGRRPSKRLIERIRAALETVAWLVREDDAYIPIFLRLERELEMAETMSGGVDPLAWARAYVRTHQH